MGNRAQKAGPLVYDLCSTLHMIEDARACGVLTFSGDGETHRLMFERGNVSAASSSRLAQFGKELVASGQVSQALLDTVLGLQRRKKNEARLGEILVSLGVVTANGVREVLRRQCVAVLRYCLECEGGAFDFGTETAPEGDVDVRFSVSELLEEAQEAAS